MKTLSSEETPQEGHRAQNRRDVLHACLVAIAVGVLLLRFFAISTSFPYYFTWDMDLTVVEDCILVHSGFTPDTIAHPGFGMYLILVTTQRIGLLLGALSPVSLDDLAVSLNPLTCVAELTTLVRFHAPVVAAATVLLLWASVMVLFRPSRLLSVLSFAVLGVQESLVYHASQGRTELYSIFFWSGAVLAVSIAVRQKRPGRYMASLFIAGVCLGLSYLTKMQSLFYLVACPVVLLFALVARPDSPSAFTQPISRRARQVLFVSGLTALAVFIALLLAAWRVPYPEGKNGWQSDFSLWPMAMCVCLAFGAVAVGQFMACRREERSTWGALFPCVTLVMIGFVAAFLLHFAMYPNPSVSLKYLLYDTKMLFLSQTYSSAKAPVEHIRDFKEFLHYDPTLFAIHGLSLLGLVYAALAPRGRRRWGLVGAGLLLTCLAMVNVGLAARFILRDLLWAEILITFLTLLYLSAARENMVGRRFLGTVLAAGLMVMLVGVEMGRHARMLSRIDANVNRFGYHSEHWLTNVFTHNQARYVELMASRYQQNQDTVYLFGKPRPAPKSTVPPDLLQDPAIAKKHAVRHRELKRLVSSIFKNQSLSHKHIGLVAERFPVWTEDLDWRIQAFPESLRLAVVVDSAPVPLRDKFFFREEYAARGGGHHVLDKIKHEAPPGCLAVLARPDFRVLLFVGERDAAKVAELQTMVLTGEPITLVGRGSTKALQAVETMNYAEIPVAKFEAPYFFVLQEREHMPQDWERPE